MWERRAVLIVVVLVLCVCLVWGEGVERGRYIRGVGVVGVCVAGEWVQVLLVFT